VLRDLDDPNDVTVMLGWSDLEKARSFIQSASLKDAMQSAGVTSPPEIRFLETVG
jgi:heme-degrading monooxygenase HmoA